MLNADSGEVWEKQFIHWPSLNIVDFCVCFVWRKGILTKGIFFGEAKFWFVCKWSAVSNRYMMLIWIKTDGRPIKNLEFVEEE